MYLYKSIIPQLACVNLLQKAKTAPEHLPLGILYYLTAMGRI